MQYPQFPLKVDKAFFINAIIGFVAWSVPSVILFVDALPFLGLLFFLSPFLSIVLSFIALAKYREKGLHIILGFLYLALTFLWFYWIYVETFQNSSSSGWGIDP